MRKTLLFFLPLVIAGVLFLSSCRPEEGREKEPLDGSIYFTDPDALGHLNQAPDSAPMNSTGGPVWDTTYKFPDSWKNPADEINQQILDFNDPSVQQREKYPILNEKGDGGGKKGGKK